MTLDDVIKMLEPPVSRDNVIEIIAHGVVLPKAARAMAYMIVQGMSQSDLDKIGMIAVEAVKAAQKGDMQTLDNLMTENKVPPQFTEVVKQYAANISEG